MRLLNKLILQFPDNVYLVETKADILISYGYKKEAIKFYKKVLEVIPDNNYAKLRIFLNLDIDSLNYNQKKQLFNEYINLLFDFPKSIKIKGKYNIESAPNLRRLPSFLTASFCESSGNAPS